MKQDTIEWHIARLGKITGSEIHRCIGSPRKRETYARQLLEEIEAIESGRAEEYVAEKDFYSPATDWGKQHEPQARKNAELINDIEIVEAGLMIHPDYPFIACSVDGLYSSGLAEIKCPWSSSDHILCFVQGMPVKHVPQVQGNLWITGQPEALFVSYDPRLSVSRRYWQTFKKQDQDAIEVIKENALSLWHDLVIAQNFTEK